MRWKVSMLMLLATLAWGQPKRVLYLTHSAGYRHDVLPVSAEVLRNLAESTGRLQMTTTDDVSWLNRLAEFDAVLFYTSGELPVTEEQKAALLQFVRAGKGFGGFHSATDTFYQWPEYGLLIGARFNGHPWTRTASVDIEDPEHPAARHLGNSFQLVEEFYQFREFTRERSRVLMTLNLDSVPRDVQGINPFTEDFPLAWVHRYGEGRVFYTALGHFESTWRDSRFQQITREALLWLTGLLPGESSPRPPTPAQVAANGIGNAASMRPLMSLSPGTLFSIYGTDLTPGATMRGEASKLAGTRVLLNGRAVPLLYASPSQINAYLPFDVPAKPCPSPVPPGCRGPSYDIRVETPGAEPDVPRVSAMDVTPGVFTTTLGPGSVTIWATGLGRVERVGPYEVTLIQPEVTIGGKPARVLYSGLAPGFAGLYQVNVELPAALPSPALVEFRVAGTQSNFWIHPQ